MERKNPAPGVLCLSIALVTALLLAGCTGPIQGGSPANQVPPGGQNPSAGPKDRLLVATTTSLSDTGLLDYLERIFENNYAIDLQVTSQGTGKAIEIAKRGDCDLLVVHSPAQEEDFMEAGHGINRRCFAYNYFIVAGPADDPAGIRGMEPKEAFRTIIGKGKSGTPGVFFVSRGDNSGTHNAEKNIWNATGYNYTSEVRRSGAWYIEAGRGMGETLQLASEKGAYTLTDEGTFLTYRGRLDLVPLIDKGDILLNIYSVITVYTEDHPVEKITMANNFVNFLISPEIQAAIGEYGREKYGKGLFTPMSGGCLRFGCDCTTPASATRPSLSFT
ncbi:MAG: substrate-binding domain-containing protein [Methanolinea sp.]|nr:substrate-binding domain-containing protein [Methanolinea sp.]